MTRAVLVVKQQRLQQHQHMSGEERSPSSSSGSRKRRVKKPSDDDRGERRRETSRFAARDRRGQETEVFALLKAVVPVVDEPTFTHVDRIAQLRLATTYCRLRDIVPQLIRPELSEQDAHLWSEAELSRCLDGFALVCSSDAVILYVTESVSDYLGLTQTDLIGRWLVDFVHQDDYDDFRRMCGRGRASGNSAGPSTSKAAAKPEGDDQQTTAAASDRLIVLRMKSVVSPRGRQLNLRHALLKAIAFRMRTVEVGGDGRRVHLLHASTIPVGQGKAYATPAVLEGSSGAGGIFMTRHTCDMRFSYANESVTDHLGLDPKRLIGTSFYTLIHPEDLPAFVVAVKELLKKQHTRTPYYRLVGKRDRTVWVQTEATIVQQKAKGQRSQYVICVHQLLGLQESAMEPIASGPAAVPVIKTEVDDDSLDYLLYEPGERIECVDFTPLIGGDKTPFHLASSTPPASTSAAAGQQGAPAVSSSSGAAGGYDEVLEWLLRDMPPSPPPYSAATSTASISPSLADFFTTASGLGTTSPQLLNVNFADCTLHSPPSSRLHHQQQQQQLQGQQQSQPQHQQLQQHGQQQQPFAVTAPPPATTEAGMGPPSDASNQFWWLE